MTPAPAVRAVQAPATARSEFDRASAQSAGLSLAPLPFFTPDAIWSGGYTPPAYLVKGMIARRAVTTIFGDQGTYKSAISIALATCIGSGRAFYGVRTRSEPAGVVYLAGEGCAGMPKRLRGLMMAHDLTAADPAPLIAITEMPANLVGNAEQLRATVAAAAEALGTEIAAVFIDTLTANFGEGEENSASDMTLAIANAKRAAPDAALIVVHHSGHGESGRERGSSSLPFGADFRFRTKYDKAAKTVCLENLKQKDDEALEPMFFAPRRVGVEWLDSDGEELTSVVLDRVEDPMPSTGDADGSAQRQRAPGPGPGKNQETVLKVLARLRRVGEKNLQDSGLDPRGAKVSLNALRTAVVVDGKFMERQRYPEALDGLVKRGLIRIDGPHVFSGNEP